MTDPAPRLVFTGGQIFDGTGADPFRADLLLQGDVIVAIGSDLEGDVEIDVTAMCTSCCAASTPWSGCNHRSPISSFMPHGSWPQCVAWASPTHATRRAQTSE
jgi:hypothetical protein